MAALLADVLDKLNDIQARAHGRQAEQERKKPERLSTEVAIVHFERPRAQATAGRRSSTSFGWPMRMWLPNGSRRPQSMP